MVPSHAVNVAEMFPVEVMAPLMMPWVISQVTTYRAALETYAWMVNGVFALAYHVMVVFDSRVMPQVIASWILVTVAV